MLFASTLVLGANVEGLEGNSSSQNQALIRAAMTTTF